ncbi:beta-glucosidase BglX [Natronosalvus rutilus]|uniref:beta-glucosidase n=1 Tax=Natronosalvus rutilus TaxID=2953753 RepID=A0A9E7N628_9EURY|nr:beta-glucosidase BglX [Natronosalvus rutilus]UTF52230.1 beta-glucosidase BglX [Natronosalvus rutilus]
METNTLETPYEDEIESLIEQMTVTEKVGQLNQLCGSEQTGPAVDDVDLEAEIRNGNAGSLLNVTGLETKRRYQRLAVEESRLGIPLLFGFDVVHGHKTIFPIPLAEAASWNREAVRESGAVAAAEAAADGIHWTFAPPVDVTRDARWGRVMETSGEDPYLASELGAEKVRGFQGEDLSRPDTVLACAKHYLAYGEVEAGREYNTVDISGSTLREVHLPPFQAAVDAGVRTVMNAFTDVNGVPATGNERIISEILKGELGFGGFMVSDWNSFRELIYHGVAADEREAAELAFTAGSDVDMVGHVYTAALADLVNEGRVSETRLDDAVRRVLRAKFELGLFEDPYRYIDRDRRNTTVLADEHQETARDVARESIVLLKNDGDVLPFEDIEELAVIGGLADSHDDVLGNWRSRGEPEHAVSVLDGVRSAADSSTTVTYARGCDRSGETSPDLRREAVDTAARADASIVVVGEQWQQSGECSSRTRIDLPGQQQELLEAVLDTGTPVVAVLMNGRPLAIPWVAENVPAILETWFLGTQAGNAVADVLFGAYTPSGKLPISFPRHVGQVPIHYDHFPTGRPKEHAEPGWSSSYIDEQNEPLYSFGHGLSYTTFEYSDLELSDSAIGMDERLTVTATIKNTGDVAGEEIVQLYVHDEVGSRTRPVKELKGFHRVELAPGETRPVQFTLDQDDLAFWTLDEEMAAEPGTFDVMIGRSADDVRLADSFELRET